MELDHAKLAESFGTLSETVNALKQLGYQHDFNIKNECIICHQTNIIMSPEDFQIDKVYRFEGESNPDDESVVYAISSPKYGVSGTLVNGYGISADETASRLVQILETHARRDTAPETVTANEATPLRPEGDRILNAPLVRMDLQEFMTKIKNEETWKSGDRNSMTIFKSDRMRIVLLGLRANAELKPHKANGVISVQVIQGKIEFGTDDERCTLENGQMLALHENIMHSVKALEDSFFLLTLAMREK